MFVHLHIYIHMHTYIHSQSDILRRLWLFPALHRKMLQIQRISGTRKANPPRTLGRHCPQLGHGRNTVSRVLFRKRELTEFCGKLGEFCERLGELALAHTHTIG